MAAANKRKLEAEFSNQFEKKPHQEFEFSRSGVRAESTMIEELNDSEKIDKLLADERYDENSSDEDMDSILVDTIVSAVSERENSLAERLASLISELLKRDEEVKRLAGRNKELAEKLHQKDMENEELKICVTGNSIRIKKYKSAIIRMNETIQIKPSLPTPNSDNENDKEKKEAEEIRSADNTVSTNENKSKIKCRYEDKGSCKNKETCEYQHPKQICYAYSKFGRCQNSNRCQHRHPNGICHQWKKHNECSRGRSCRYCHPIISNKSNFLGNFIQGLFELRLLW